MMGIESACIVGLGYVGLTLSAFLASKGIRVYGVDVDEEKVEALRRGEMPLYEPGVEELLREHRDKLRFTTHVEEAVRASDVIFICVGTPSRPDGSIDLRYVESAGRSVGRALDERYKLLVVKSTVVPGTTRGVFRRCVEGESGLRAGRDFGLCMNPEFLREGSALRDLERPSKIVIGEYDQRSGDLLEAFYRRIYGSLNVPIVRTSLEAAEMIKYANNAFLAMKVSFINTIANICELVPGCDVVEVARALGLDPRISPRFLRAGVGYGGSCFPKDLRALIAFAEERGYEPLLLKAVEEVNHRQPLRAVELCERLVGDLRGKVIAVLGLSFKPGTDDMREAPSIKIVKALVSRGARVRVYDPAALKRAREVFADSVEYADSAYSCISGADCAVVVTEWDEFKRLKPQDFKKLMRSPSIVDGRRIYNPLEFLKAGVKFAAIGLGKHKYP